MKTRGIQGLWIVRRFSMTDEDQELHGRCEAWWTECHEDSTWRCVDNDGDDEFLCEAHAREAEAS